MRQIKSSLLHLGISLQTVWRRRVIAPLVVQLRKGMAPEKLTLTVALGAVVGIFPILGATTPLCALTAWMLRLNQPVIQLVHLLVYPIQLALLLAFYSAGESLFGKPHIDLSIPMLVEEFWAAPGDFLLRFGMIGVQGIVVWLLLAPIMVGILYLSLLPPIRLLSSDAQA